MNPADFPPEWNEPPVTAEERLRAERLDRPGPAETPRQATTAHGSDRADDDPARDLAVVQRCAAAFQRQARLLDDQPAQEASRGKAPSTVKTVPFPDPFPGEYRIVRLLGHGGFGMVWLADDLNLGCPVALKSLRLTGESGQRAQALALLRNEAQQVAPLRHPNIVRVRAWRSTGDEHFLVLDYVRGGSFADRLRKDGPLDWQLAARYIADVGEGLLALHTRGVLHRDIKPANILWDPDQDEALLTDFGLAARLSQAGDGSGSYGYIPLEAFRGQVTPAADVYSLAVTLFELLTGELPFAAASLPDLLEKLQRGLPDPDPRLEDVPETLERVLRQGMSVAAEVRPPLADFVRSLRSELNLVLTDTFLPGWSDAPARAVLPGSPPAGSSPCPARAAPQPAPELRLTLSREVAPGRYEPVATSASVGGRKRNMKKVPRQPEQVRLRTGDRVRIEVVSSRVGYVTVFNVGPTGDFTMLYPDEPSSPGTPPSVQPNRPLHVLDVEMAPPTGSERLFAVWTQGPVALAPEELPAVAEQAETACSRAARATRNMVRMQEKVRHLATDNWQAAVLAIEHEDQV